MLLKSLWRKRNFKPLKLLKKLKPRPRRREKDKMMIQLKMIALLKWTKCIKKKFMTYSCHPVLRELSRIRYPGHSYSVLLSLII